MKHTCKERGGRCAACVDAVMRAAKTVTHARWHCLFGSNTNCTIRTPDAGDLAAAEILAAALKEVRDGF